MIKKNSQEKTQKSGFVAILGLANAGKSTLLNSCVKTKLAGVSKRPQTTRHKIMGIISECNCQIIFIDTPGILTQSRNTQLDKFYTNQTYSALSDADIIVFLIDSNIWYAKNQLKEKLIANNFKYLDKILQMYCKTSQCKVLLMLSKKDKLNKHQIANVLIDANNRFNNLMSSFDKEFAKIVNQMIICDENDSYFFALSSKLLDDLDCFKINLYNNLPEHEFYYDKDIKSDKSNNFVISEIIREFIFRRMGDEIPYSTAVTTQINTFNHQDHSILKPAEINCTIMVNKKSHKGMIIGKNGAKLADLRKYSTPKIERYLNCKIKLSFWVKVQKNWTENKKNISDFL